MIVAAPRAAPRRVCVLTSVHHPFDQRVFYKEAVSLAQAGYDVTLVGPAPPALQGKHMGVTVQPLPPGRSRWGRAANHLRLFREARAQAADVYHVHDPELLPMGCLLRLLGRRVIYDVHEHYPAVALTRAWIPRLLRRPLARAVDLAERLMARALHGVVGVVEEQQSRFPSRPFAAVRNYPRLEWFRPRAGAPLGCVDAPPLLHVGSLSPDRGAAFLLEVMRELGRTHPQAGLDALGPFHSPADEDGFRAGLERYGLRSRVRCCTRHLPYHRLGPFISRHRVGLIPGQVSAKNLTPFVPTKLFEYLACGVPVVASALPSIEGFHRLGEWGILVDPADPVAHARAIARLLDDPEGAALMGARGRALVEAKCNWQAESEKLLALYRGLFEPSRRRSQ